MPRGHGEGCTAGPTANGRAACGGTGGLAEGVSMSARMDNSIPSILWRLRSIEELLDRTGDAMADVDANKNCIHFLAAMLGETIDDLDTTTMRDTPERLA
jgi:hypothetical protein